MLTSPERMMAELAPSLLLATSWWVIGAGFAGLLAGLALWFLLRRWGWWGEGEGWWRWWRGLIALWLAACGAVGGGAGMVTFAAVHIADATVRASPIATEVTPKLGKLGADLIAWAVFMGPQLEAGKPPDKMPLDVAARAGAFAMGKLEIDLVEIRDAQLRLQRALRTPEGEALARRISELARRSASDEQTSQMLPAVVSMGLNEIARDRPSDERVVVFLASLPAAAASSGRPDALSRAELARQVGEVLVLPGVIAGVAQVLANASAPVMFLGVFGWLLVLVPAGLRRLFRRVFVRKPDVAPPDLEA